MKMSSLETGLVTPPGLEILLEGMTRAALEKNPDNMIEFFAFYFQELITFRKGHSQLDITELVEMFDFISNNGDEGLGEKTLQHADILLSGERMRSDKCTDTQEDQLLQESDIQYSSKETQCPSVASSFAESKSPPGSDGASCPASPELAYTPAEPAQLAAHVLGSWGSLYSMKDVATSVQTLHEDSQTSEEEFTPAEDAAEGASAVPAAEASVETLGSQPGVRSQSPIAGELGPSGSQADASTTDVLQASSAPLWEEPSPSPTRKDSLETVPSCNEDEVPSATEVVSQCWDAGLILCAEVPPYVEQFPQKIIIPFVDQTAYLDAENGDEGLDKKTSEHAGILFSGERLQSAKRTDTEEDQLLQESDIQYSSKETQCPSVASSLAESKSRPGSDGASCPASPELVYTPAEPAQLAAHVLGSWGSLYSMKDVATSVQTLHEDSQTSEEEFTPAEDAAEGASAVPAAEASVETLGSQPGVRSQSPIAGELGPSGSQADASTTDVFQASSAPLWEEPPPSSLLPPPPSPTRKDSLETVPSCNEENGDEGLDKKTSEHAGILFSGERLQSAKRTDTEEDQLLQESDIQYSSKETQCPSVASSLAESKSRPGSDGASCPASPELVYTPAEPAQLAAHVLGSWGSLYSMRDVATSVQTLHEDSQTSEEEFTPAEDAAEGASAVPAAEASVETLGSQPGVRSQSPIAGELGPSGSQADASTTDVFQASSAPLWEEPPPSSLLPPPPSPTRKDSLETVPSCNEGEVPSATEVVSQCWDAELILDSEVPPYVEQFPQKIIIPFVDQTAYLLKIKPLSAVQGSSATILGPTSDDLVCHPERMESKAEVETAEQVSILSAMASSAAGQPPHHNVWTLYRLTDLRQGQKSPPSLPCAGAGVAYSPATLRLFRGEDQQCGQLSHVPAPIYVMKEESKRGNAPPFILVGSNVQDIQDWKPIPSHTVFAQQDAGARRFITVPVARPADEETDLASPSCKSAEKTGTQPCTATVFSVAVPLDDVMAAMRGSPAGDKHTG